MTMTVAELIAKLEKLPKDKIVMGWGANGYGPINKITEYADTIEIERQSERQTESE